MIGQVKRNFYIPDWADKALDSLYQRTGDSKAHHMRKALVEYLERNGITTESLLARQHLHDISRKIEARNDADNSWVSHDELMASLEEKHGPELIASINEEVAANVAG